MSVAPAVPARHAAFLHTAIRTLAAEARLVGLAALEHTIVVYRELRDSVGADLRRHHDAEAAAVAYLSHVAERLP